MPNEKPVPQQIPIEKIHDLPGIPKITMSDKSYGGLVASVLLDGVKEPVILRQREDGEYQLVSGYRRRKATELAKLKTMPALVYDMTEKDALEYHKIANLNPDAPIPGKLVEKDSKAPTEKKPIEPVKPDEKKTEPPKVDKATAPAEKKPVEPVPGEKKVEAPKAEKAEAPAEKKPTEPVKPDEKKTEAPKVEKTEATTEKKPTEPVKPDEKKAETPKAEKAETPAEKKPVEPVKPDEKKAEAPKAEKAEAPADKKPTEPVKPDEKKAEPPKVEKTEAPADKKPAEPVKPDEKKAEAPKVEKTEAPDNKKPAEPVKPAEKKAEPPKAEKPAKAPAAKKKEAEEKPVGKTAIGPTGTAITQLLGEKLNPPTAKDIKALPIPGEGEAFSAVLHPAYLKKAEINTFSVDRNSDDFKELYKSIERFGVKDPVLARFNKDGELEILSGQRRHLIASELNYPVPTIIQQLDDDDAKILVADGNLHREHISTYDLSRALRMKADSMKRKAGRKLRGVKGGPETDELIAKEMGMSTMKLNRLMKLSEATQQICDLVDDGTIAVSIAYNLAFLQPKHQDTVADLIGINVKVNNENTTNLKKIAARESLTEQKIRDVLEGKYPPKVVEKPKAAEPPAQPAPAMAPAPASIPKSPDMGTPVPGQPSDKVIPFPSAPGQDAAPTVSGQDAVPSQPAVPGQSAAPTAPTPPAPAEAAPTAPAAEPPAPAAPGEAPKETQDRENSYETKIVLRGDRLRKYFPDVSMTPLAIENSIYDALEERRQRQAREKAKTEIFKGKKEPVK